MDHLHFDKLTPGTIGLFIGAIVLVWLLYNATKHLVMAFFCLVVAVTGVGYATGVLSTEKAIAKAKEVGKDGLEAAETKAKAVEERVRERAKNAPE